ncbi:hypothetical protein RQP46_002586 [Phenoliferia psychrophenolica]
MSNFSYYAIPAAWVSAMVPHFYAAALSKSSKDMPGFTNSEPREFLHKCRTLEKQSKDVKTYLRAEAASQNGFETLALFAASIVAGNVAQLPIATLNAFAGVYLGTRVLYINTTSESVASLRSLAWLGGIGTMFTLFIKSGKALDALRI